MTRYAVGGEEGKHEPGSDGRVLANRLGITDPAEMDDAELELLLRLYEEVLPTVDPSEAITSAMICEWHRKWLASIYPWAGRIRSVDLEKDGFRFAHAAQIPRLLDELDRDVLGELTPCRDMTEDELAQAIAKVHVELILIHPFREGNGRIARVVADAMASQAGFGPLDYTAWDDNKKAYIGAIHAAMDCNYGPMEALATRALSDGSGSDRT
jgi:cell filamentation protein